MTQELRDECTSFSNWLNQLEERVSVIEDQMNEMKQEEKLRDKRVKRNEQSLQKYRTMWKDKIYIWLVYLKVTGRMEQTRKHSSRYYPGDFPNLARQANIQIQEI